jgi:predicted short-subunit dehydrogenase-like oxidoreductase (DUF2520 family)
VLASNLLIAPLVAATKVMIAAGFDAATATAALTPLSTRAVNLALEQGPDAQPTGPLARGDAATIADHRRTLAAVDHQLDLVYTTLSRLALAHVPAEAAANVRAELAPTGAGRT